MTTLRDLLNDLATECLLEGLSQGDITGLAKEDKIFIENKVDEYITNINERIIG